MTPAQIQAHIQQHGAFLPLLEDIQDTRCGDAQYAADADTTARIQDARATLIDSAVNAFGPQADADARAYLDTLA